MAPVKVPKKPLKTIEITKPISKLKKKKKKNYQGFSIYIYKLLKTIARQNLGISQKSMLIMNNFVNDMLEKIALEAGRLVAHRNTKTMSSKDIQTAVRLLIPGELAIHANIEGMKAITMYHKSHEKDGKQ